MAVSRPPLPSHLGRRLRESRALITGRWLERIAARTTVPPQQVFPTDDLLDHIPLLVEGIAAYVEEPSDVIPADSLVVHHARELGALRHAQGFSEYEVLKEFEILGAILFSFTSAVAAEIDPQPDQSAAFACSARVFHAVSLIQQATTARFLELAKGRLADREDRLRVFHRALTHEMRNRIGATLGAGQLLQTLDMSPEQREQLAGVIVRNADSLRLILENLLELSRLENDTRQQRHVPLASAVQEAARQLREMAAIQKVEIRISPDLPPVEVNAAVLELCLSNLLANGIKYADPEQSDRWVSVSARVETAPDSSAEVVVVVEDNGIGIPAAARERLFERFYRAHATSHPSVQGTGLGLSLVREALEAVGGRVWLEPTERGTRLAFAQPSRRASDRGSIVAAVQSPASSESPQR